MLTLVERDMSVCGAILIGGASRRMGAPKHAVALANGKTMLQTVADALRPVCDALAIVGVRQPAHARDIRDRFPNAALLHDTRPGDGPLAGIEAVLASRLCDTYIICACDMILLNAEVIAALARPCSALTAVLRLEGEASSRPLPCRVHASALPTVTRLLDAEQRAVRFLHREVGSAELAGPAEWAEALTDINTPSDLAWANAQLASSSGHPGVAPLAEPKSLSVRRSRSSSSPR